ncbi:MAG: hypothetical protein AVDCRST_MAG08-1255, partial [uncultured Acetobacteraceae bacterium]
GPVRPLHRPEPRARNTADAAHAGARPFAHRAFAEPLTRPGAAAHGAARPARHAAASSM